MYVGANTEVRHLTLTETVGQGSEGRNVSHPRIVKQAKGTTIVRAAAGQLHTLLLSSAGIVSSFGHNEFGQLGESFLQ